MYALSTTSPRFSNNNNNNNNNKTPATYGKDAVKVKVEVKDKINNLIRQANFADSKDESNKAYDVQVKKPEVNDGETYCRWQNIFTRLSNGIKDRHYSPMASRIIFK